MRVKLSSIVAQYLDLVNLGKAEYARAYRVAIRGWRELNWDIVGSVKTVKLPVSANKTIALPDDFISEIDFGRGNLNGGIQSYTKTDNFNTVDFLYPKISHTRDDVNQSYLVSGYDVGTYSLGLGSSNNIGYYYIDKAKHLIFLSPDNEGGELTLKYLAYSGKDCDDHEINELATEALICYLDWQLSKADRRMGISEKREKERMYYNEKSKARLRIKKITVADMNQNSRESVKMSVKS